MTHGRKDFINDPFGTSMAAGFFGLLAGSGFGEQYMALGAGVGFIVVFITILVINARVEIARQRTHAALTEREDAA